LIANSNCLPRHWFDWYTCRNKPVQEATIVEEPHHVPDIRRAGS
jgi:hypothetical protein